MMIVSLRQHSVIAVLIGGIAFSIALSGSAFAQIKMDMSNSSAEFAAPANGIITTKSGTNHLHGSGSDGGNRRADHELI